MTSLRRAIGEKLFNINAPEDSGSENDPETWDDPAKPSLFERLLPTASPKQKTVLLMAVISLVGFGVYLTRFFPADTVLASTAFLAGWPVMYYAGRKKSWEVIRSLDWNIMLAGDTPILRYGKAKPNGNKTPYENAIDDDGWLFQEGKSVDLRGNVDYLEVRDIFGDPTNLRAKIHRTGKTGDSPSRDYLPDTFTWMTQTKTLGNVYVTLTDGLERYPNAPDIDRAASMPSMMPEDTISDIRSMFTEFAEIHLPAAHREAQMHKNRADEAERPKRELVKEYLDDLVTLMDQTGVGARRAHRSLAQQYGFEPSQSGGNGTAGSLPPEVRQSLEELDEEVDNEQENGGVRN